MRIGKRGRCVGPWRRISLSTRTGWRRFFGNERGNFAVTMGTMAPVIFGVVGLSFDYSIYMSQRSGMQEAADQAVLAAVREASLQGWSASAAKAVVDRFVSSTLSGDALSSAQYESTVTVDEKNNRVRVAIRQDGHGYLLLGFVKSNPQIEVTSEAVLASASNICVLTLKETTSRTLFSRNASMTGVGCGFFANSTDSRAVVARKGGFMSASTICSAGGYGGGNSSFNPTPVTDCPPVPDPLAQRPAPKFSGCDFRDTEIDSSRVTLKPGVYCGGLKITGKSEVNLRPGVYVIKDGEFSIQGNATLKGEHVGFYLTGSLAKTRFANSTTISLTAPKSGPLAGILIFEDRNSAPGREFEISSKDAQTLIGTIYLPKGYLKVKGKSKFADASDWTAIIAQDVRILDGPALELNSDYTASDIPVPAGISAASGRAYLTE